MSALCLHSTTIEKMILMITEVYRPEICVIARSRGATSGLLLSAVFTHFLPVLSISALYLHSTIEKMILLITEVYRPEICVIARSRGATSGLSLPVFTPF